MFSFSPSRSFSLFPPLSPDRARLLCTEKELSMGNSSLVMRDRWTQKSGSLFREREPGKEIQPAMVRVPQRSPRIL